MIVLFFGPTEPESTHRVDSTPTAEDYVTAAETYVTVKMWVTHPKLISIFYCDVC